MGGTGPVHSCRWVITRAPPPQWGPRCPILRSLFLIHTPRCLPPHFSGVASAPAAVPLSSRFAWVVCLQGQHALLAVAPLLPVPSLCSVLRVCLVGIHPAEVPEGHEHKEHETKSSCIEGIFNRARLRTPLAKNAGQSAGTDAAQLRGKKH